MGRLTLHLLAALVMCLAVVGRLEAQRPASGGVPRGAKLYVAPMEWGLDRFVAAEIRRCGLPVEVVATAEEADFLMTSLYQGLGSHLMSPGHCIQVKIVASDGGRQVWFGEADDYALFFGRLRPHGPAKAAAAIVKKLFRDMSRSGR